MKSAVQKREGPDDSETSRWGKALWTPALLSIAAALALRPVGSIAHVLPAVLILALAGAHWARLGRREVAGGLAAVAFALGAGLASMLALQGTAAWKPILVIAMIVHGGAAARLAALGRSQAVVAYSSLALGIAVALGGVLTLEARGSLAPAEALQASWQEVVDEMLAMGGIAPPGADATPSSDAIEEWREQLEQFDASEIVGIFVAIYAMCFVLFGGFVVSGPAGFAAFLAFRATEYQAPYLILALAGEAVRRGFDYPLLAPYTVPMLYAFGALVWLQALAVFRFQRAVGLRTQRPQLVFVSGLGIVVLLLMPLAGAVIGLLDIYFDLRKLNAPSGEPRS